MRAGQTAQPTRGTHHTLLHASRNSALDSPASTLPPVHCVGHSRPPPAGAPEQQGPIHAPTSDSATQVRSVGAESPRRTHADDAAAAPDRSPGDPPLTNWLRTRQAPEYAEPVRLRPGAPHGPRQRSLSAVISRSGARPGPTAGRPITPAPPTSGSARMPQSRDRSATIRRNDSTPGTATRADAAMSAPPISGPRQDVGPPHHHAPSTPASAPEPPMPPIASDAPRETALHNDPAALERKRRTAADQHDRIQTPLAEVRVGRNAKPAPGAQRTAAPVLHAPWNSALDWPASTLPPVHCVGHSRPPPPGAPEQQGPSHAPASDSATQVRSDKAESPRRTQAVDAAAVPDPPLTNRLRTPRQAPSTRNPSTMLRTDHGSGASPRSPVAAAPGRGPRPDAPSHPPLQRREAHACPKAGIAQRLSAATTPRAQRHTRMPRCRLLPSPDCAKTSPPPSPPRTLDSSGGG